MPSIHLYAIGAWKPPFSMFEAGPSALGYRFRVPADGRELRDFGRLLRSVWAERWASYDPATDAVPILITFPTSQPVAILEAGSANGEIEVSSAVGRGDLPLCEEDRNFFIALVRLIQART